MARGRKCNAKRKDGSICKQAAGHGTDHPGYGNCKMHYGSTISGKAKAAREAWEARLGEQAAEIFGPAYAGGLAEVSPEEALLEEVRRTAGHVRFLEAAIALEMDPDLAARAQFRYERERKHLVGTCQIALHAGIEERAVRLAERMGDQLAELIRGLLNDLQLTPEQQERAPEIVRSHIRLLESGAGAV